MGGQLRSGGCLCGAVRFVVTGEPMVMCYCHCESCRRWIGAPVHGSSLWLTENVEIAQGADTLATFKRTPESGSLRRFCKSCGTPVLIDHPGAVALTDIPAVSITDLDFLPALHTHYGERVVSMPDGLPKYKDFDPAVGGSGEMGVGKRRALFGTAGKYQYDNPVSNGA
jgi:hypothetical protein